MAARVPGAACAVQARREHLESLVECHLAALPGAYVTRLGRRFVCAHDRFYIEQPDGTCLVTLDDITGKVTGFILGGSPDVRGRLARRYWLLLLASIIARSTVDSVVRSRTVAEIADAIRAALRRLGLGPPASEAIPADPPGTWGTSIVFGTHPDFRTGGADKAIALLEGIHRECARLGFKVTRATTETGNTVSHLLHTRLGWKVLGIARGYYHYRREVEETA